VDLFRPAKFHAHFVLVSGLYCLGVFEALVEPPGPFLSCGSFSIDSVPPSASVVALPSLLQ